MMSSLFQEPAVRRYAPPPTHTHSPFLTVVSCSNVYRRPSPVSACFNFSMCNPFVFPYSATNTCILHSLNHQLRHPKTLNPILHTAWLDNHALTFKRNTAKYYFHQKSRFLLTFVIFCYESRKS